MATGCGSILPFIGAHHPSTLSAAGFTSFKPGNQKTGEISNYLWVIGPKPSLVTDPFAPNPGFVTRPYLNSAGIEWGAHY